MSNDRRASQYCEYVIHSRYDSPHAKAEHIRNSKNFIGTSSCDGGEFECTDGECIYAFFICDGENDCTDSSDESPSICAALGATGDLQTFPLVVTVILFTIVATLAIG